MKEIGIAYLLILAPLLLVGILGVLQYIFTSKDYSTALISLLILASVHWNRKDRFFLEQVPSPLFLFFLLDYSLIFSPIIACFVFWGKWINLLIISIGIIILSFTKPFYRQQDEGQLANWFKVGWIPVFLFEWRCGLRKNRLAFLIIYFLSLSFSYYAIVVPITLLLMAMGVTTFFQYFENKDLLLAGSKNQRLLSQKSLGSLKLFSLIILPQLIFFLIFNHDYQHIIALLVVYLVSQTIIVFSICMKYKSYRFGAYKVHNTLPLAIFVGCLCVPFLWPIPVFMLIQYWRAAQENLAYHYY